MQTLSEIKALLSEHGLRPRHRFGQNFLHDKNLLMKLVEAANVQPGEVVLEVGPGTGTLTEELIERKAEVIAVEIDRDLASIIRQRLSNRITLIEGDCLESQRRLSGEVAQAINDRPFKLIANLPYQVASPLMAGLLLMHPNCIGQYVTIQREVADRLVAGPGTKAYGPLTVIVTALAEVKKIADLPASSFWPQPKVTSAMVAITPKPARAIDDPEAFARFVTRLFSKRRKQLGAIFGREVAAQILPAGVSPAERPDALTAEHLIGLYKAAPLSEGRS